MPENDPVTSLLPAPAATTTKIGTSTGMSLAHPIVSIRTEEKEQQEAVELRRVT